MHCVHKLWETAYASRAWSSRWHGMLLLKTALSPLHTVYLATSTGLLCTRVHRQQAKPSWILCTGSKLS